MDVTVSELRQIRQGLGITQSRLADVAGLCREEISRIERGAVKPKRETIKKIHLALAGNGHRRLTEIYRYKDARSDQIVDLEILESIDIVSKEGRHYTYKRFNDGYLIITKGR